MADIHKLSERVVDYAERMADVADAAQGKRRRRGLLSSRWVVLPAAGAGLWALVRSDSFSRQAREVMDDAKTRASELPDDLMRRVRQQPATRSTGSNGGQRTKRSTPRRSTSTRKAGSTRATTSKS